MTTSDNSQPQEPKSSTNLLKIAVWVGFGIIALLVAYLTFITVRGIVTTWQLTSLPGVNIVDTPPTPAPGENPAENIVNSPMQTGSGPTPQEWDGAKRVSILMLGLDYRDWQAGEGPPRTDTMILFTIDPVSRTAGFLSIPRDLWVNIPGYGYGRINTAYQLGEAYKLPDGGPGLAMKTVEELLGVPIDYYAQVDFGAFVRFIDEIGGVPVDVPEPIKIDLLGDGTKTIKKLKPGLQVLPGEWALAYARARKTEGGDFDRAMRQQQIIMGIRDRMINKDGLQNLITKAPLLYNELSQGINTNLTLDQAIKLAWLAVQIPEENIRKGIIGPEQVNFAVSPDGTQQVLKPITEKIRELRDYIFTETGPADPVAADKSPEELIQAENARVAALNGSYTSGLAARTTDYLKSLGINVTVTDNASKVTNYTEITFYTGKPYTVKYLVELMNISDLRIFYQNDPTSPVDIAITLGADWAQNNPMP